MEKELRKANNLLITRKYSELLAFLDEIEKKNDLSEKHKDRVFILRAQALNYLGRIDEVLIKVNQEIKDYTSKKDWINVLDSMIKKVEVRYLEKKKEEFFSDADEGLEIIKKIRKKTPEILKRKARFYLLKGEGYTFGGGSDPERAIKNLKLTFDLADELSELEMKSRALQCLGVASGRLCDYQASINYLNQAIEIYEEMGRISEVPALYQNLSVTYALLGEYRKSRECSYKHMELYGGEIALVVIGIGDSYWREGELEKGLEYMEKGIERVRDQFEDPDEHPLVLYNTANLFLRKGEIEKALEKYKKCIDLSTQKEGRDQPWSYFDIGMASCHLYKGELNEALEYAEEALEKCERNKRKYRLGWVHYLLARIFYEKNEPFTALVHAQSSLDYRQEIGNKQEIALTLRWIITLLLESQEYEEAKSFFKQLEEIANESDDLIIDRCYRLSSALMLKTKTRPKYWIQAIDILEELANEKIVDYELTVTGLILLCELLLNEFSISGDEDVLLDLQTHTSRLVDMAKKQNIYSLRVEAHNLRILSFWIQAQYSKIDIDIQNARKLLMEAKELADEKGLVKLAQKIGNQHAQLLEQLHNWNEFISKYYEFIKSE